MKNLETHHVLYSPLTQYFNKHPDQDRSVITPLIYFAFHKPEFCDALAKHLGRILLHLKTEETGTYRAIVDEINTIHPLDGGNLLLRKLFEHGSLLAIQAYITKLPIELTYQNNEGNTILHQLSNSCKNIFSYLYNNAIDDEIDDDLFLTYQIEYATDILNHLKKDRETIEFLTKEDAYVFNAKGESALSIFLNGYNSSIEMYCMEGVEIPLLNDLLIAYPKKIIIDLYEKICEDPSNLSHHFLRNLLKDALFNKEIIIKRFDFHGKNCAEHIFLEDLSFYEKISLHSDKLSENKHFILSQFLMIKDQTESHTRRSLDSIRRNNNTVDENNQENNRPNMHCKANIQRAHSLKEGIDSPPQYSTPHIFDLEINLAMENEKKTCP